MLGRVWAASFVAGAAAVALVSGCSADGGDLFQSGGGAPSGSSSSGAGAAHAATGSGSTGQGGAGASSGSISVGVAVGGFGSGGAGGAGGSAGDGGHGGSAPDCDMLLQAVTDALAKAQACKQPILTQPTPCKDVVDGVCCPVNVAFADSQETADYLAALMQWRDAGCTTTCPGVNCNPHPTAACNAPVGGTGTCVMH
ncbi:MAG TPA: hypothetical protein VHB21_11190 [Minicystis sp.]|nr:hypothetical protein [Minicystis sp.]